MLDGLEDPADIGALLTSSKTPCHDKEKTGSKCAGAAKERKSPTSEPSSDSERHNNLSLSSLSKKRKSASLQSDDMQKRARGRPKGSKNRPKTSEKLAETRLEEQELVPGNAARSKSAAYTEE